MVRDNTRETSLLEILAGFFVILRKNRALSIALPLMGLLAGVLYYARSSDLWESSILIKTSLLTPQEGEFLLAQIERAKVVPGLSADQQKQIKHVTYSLITETEGTGFDDRSIYLQATARVYQKEVFRVLENALVNLIETSPSVRRHRDGRKQYYDQLISKIDEEISAMAQVKSQVAREAQATYLNPSLLYTQTVDLFREKLSLQLKKQEIESIHLVKSFDSLSFDRKVPLLILMIVGIVAGMLLLSVVLFLKFFVSYFRGYQSSH